MWPNIVFFFLKKYYLLCGFLFTLSTLPGIFAYSKFEYFICPDWIVPYSRFTGLKNTLYTYIQREREREREREITII